MRKVFPIFAVLMATMLAIWMLGCGEDEVTCDDVVELDSTIPADGADLPAGSDLTIKFKGGTVSKVTVNGDEVDAKTTTKWTSAGLTAGQEAEITIEWEFCDGAEKGSATIKLNVVAEDKIPPAIVDSSPGDGDKDLDPAKLGEDGITVNFTEVVTVKQGDVYFQIGDDDPISWLVEPTEDKTGIILTLKGGNDLPFESEIVLKMDKVTDGAGNEANLEITFNTKAKE